MAEILIIGMPQGEAPEWVRQEWVGLKLPTFDISDSPREVLSDKPCNYIGYCVNVEKAIKILGKKHSEAAKWWRENFGAIDQTSFFVFEKKVCKLL